MNLNKKQEVIKYQQLNSSSGLLTTAPDFTCISINVNETTYKLCKGFKTIDGEKKTIDKTA